MAVLLQLIILRDQNTEEVRGERSPVVHKKTVCKCSADLVCKSNKQKNNLFF